MTDHKFEPGQLVLVRYNVGGGATWSLQHFSHLTEGECPFNSITGYSFAQCIPYTPETAHLLGTSHPYEPPKPPQEYEWGQKVEVLINGEWNKGLYIGCIPISLQHRVYIDKHGDCLFSYAYIRPLPDATAAY